MADIFVEIARPVVLLLCILSLYAVFHAAFLAPELDIEMRIWASLKLLALAGGISLVGGLLFVETADDGRLMGTLPVQVFLWAALGMVLLFAVAWYLETGVLYRDARPPSVELGALRHSAKIVADA